MIYFLLFPPRPNTAVRKFLYIIILIYTQQRESVRLHNIYVYYGRVCSVFHILKQNCFCTMYNLYKRLVLI